MTIQERRDNIFHNFGANVDEMDIAKIRKFAEELDSLAFDLEDQEALANSMKEDMLRAIKEVAYKYKKHFGSIFVCGIDVDVMSDEDIDYEE